MWVFQDNQGDDDISHDDRILMALRQLVRRYVAIQQYEILDESVESNSLKQTFAALHEQLRDPLLKSYANFELLVKLVRCEYELSCDVVLTSKSA